MLSSRKPKPPSPSKGRTGLLGRLAGALERTRGALRDGLAGVLGAGARLDESLVEDIENVLLGADVGVAATERIVGDLRARVTRREAADADAVLASLRANMLSVLEPVSRPLVVPDGGERPFVIVVVGVNGTGKTTTIGKLAHRLRASGRSVMLAAGDTFRAAAIEQLQEWGERTGAAVVAQHAGADSASVVYDALQAARARAVDVLVADTAGRLHTQTGLMEELKKVSRVIGKIDARAPHETLLVIDAGTGQNALAQARQFHAAVGVTGLALTKLDGTAKGGIVFAIAEELGIPVRFIGVGEALEDLRDFDAGEFVDALLSR